MSVNDYVNKVYIFGATIGVGYLASMVAKRTLKMNLGLPMTLEPALKMSAVLGACSVGVDYAIEKKWIPKEIIKGGGSKKKRIGLCVERNMKKKMSMLKFVNDGLGLGLTVFRKDDGSLLFKGKEVAEMLGYVNARKTITTHVSEEYRVRLGEIQKGTESVPFLGYQHPHAVLITKAGFYELAFSSCLPSAIRFRKWVFGEVLPSIRKTGAYHVSGALPKLNAITDEDIGETMDDAHKLGKFKRKLDRMRNELKDDECVRRGWNGGRKTQENRRMMIKDIATLNEENVRLYGKINELLERIRELEEELQNI